jgi:hypothetical protein
MSKSTIADDLDEAEELGWFRIANVLSLSLKILFLISSSLLFPSFLFSQNRRGRIQLPDGSSRGRKEASSTLNCFLPSSLPYLLSFRLCPSSVWC